MALVVRPPAPAVAAALLHDELAHARSYADASRAASTRRFYAQDWTRFELWCRERDIVALPADPRAVAVFLAAEAARGCAPPTVNRRLAGIGWAHRRAGHTPPQKSEGSAAIAEVLAGIHRSHARPPARKTAADADVTWAILHHITGNSLRDHRDRALIALGMAAALRRSELAALRVEDLARDAQGLRIRIARSKTDQEGAGQVVAVPHGRRLRRGPCSTPGWRRPASARAICSGVSTAAPTTCPKSPWTTPAWPSWSRGAPPRRGWSRAGSAATACAAAS